MVNPRKLFFSLFLITILTIVEVAAIESDDMRIIQANDIIAKVGQGEPINYSDVVINGDLNLSGSDIFGLRHITSPIRIRNSVLLGSINFDHAAMQEMVSIESTRCDGPVSCIGTQFNKGANFEESQFMRYCYFINSEFIDPASFIGTQFDGGANFEKSRFFGYSYFMDSRFNVSASFAYAEFNNSSNFFGAEFRGVPNFYISRFNGTASFGSVVFGDDANFGEVLFAKYTSFRKAKFGMADFTGAQFRDFADFDSAQFKNSADFIGAKFTKSLYFSGIRFAEMSIIWDSIKDQLVCDGPTYLSLIKNFKDSEKFEDADDCYYKYRDVDRQAKPSGWSKLFDYLSWLSCGYGVRWQHPILSGYYDGDSFWYVF